MSKKATRKQEQSWLQELYGDTYFEKEGKGVSRSKGDKKRWQESVVEEVETPKMNKNVKRDMERKALKAARQAELEQQRIEQETLALEQEQEYCRLTEMSPVSFFHDADIDNPITKKVFLSDEKVHYSGFNRLQLYWAIQGALHRDGFYHHVPYGWEYWDEFNMGFCNPTEYRQYFHIYNAMRFAYLAQEEGLVMFTYVPREFINRAFYCENDEIKRARDLMEAVIETDGILDWDYIFMYAKSPEISFEWVLLHLTIKTIPINS